MWFCVEIFDVDVVVVDECVIVVDDDDFVMVVEV